MDHARPTGLTDLHSSGRVTGLLLVITGFASSSIQFILLREAVILGGGSEASSGIFLWLWLMISSAGAFTAGKSHLSSLRKIMMILITGLTFSLICYPVITSMIVKPGEIPTFLKSLLIISITVAPATFISSFVFVRLASVKQKSDNYLPGKSFGLETAGSAAAGIFTAISLSVYIPNFIYSFIVIICSVLALVPVLFEERQARLTTLFFGFALLILLLFVKPDKFIRGLLLRGVKVESSIDTPYGNITTASYGGERTVFYDHRPLFFSGDIARTEEDVHYALLQRENNGKILMISGGMRKHLAQIRKYKVKELTYIEHDPGVIVVEQANDTIDGDIDVTVVRNDPIQYFRNNSFQFNAIIQLIPSPASLSVNRYFTLEYFRSVKAHLSPGGVFLCTPMPYHNYSPENFTKALSPVYNSLKEVFVHLVIIPGSQLYIIASDDPLSAEISNLVKERSIVNDYVNSNYITDSETIRRGGNILSKINSAEGLNTSLRPLSTWFSDSLTLEMRGIKGTTLLVIALLMILPFLFMRRGGFLMFAASAGLAGYGMIIIFLIQVTIGSMYLFSSVVLSLLMAGLAAGASIKKRFIELPLIAIPFILAAIYLITGLLSPLLLKISPTFMITIAAITLLSAGFLTGRIFRILTISSSGSLTGNVYGSDLAGAALGYVTVSSMLVPLTGIVFTSVIIAAFILIAVALVSIVIKH